MDSNEVVRKGNLFALFDFEGDFFVYFLGYVDQRGRKAVFFEYGEY